ncbi:uncharacterized protein J3D65DRAFT_308142 [Phyllosticta citribraziliensis]|uniref:Uncharacterized protein n=1 Tax=Phyllosticta citribraziliensis TaxID=989973 RepID=A0ABR1LXY5_9PEZI
MAPNPGQAALNFNISSLCRPTSFLGVAISEDDDRIPNIRWKALQFVLREVRLWAAERDFSDGVNANNCEPLLAGFNLGASSTTYSDRVRRILRKRVLAKVREVVRDGNSDERPTHSTSSASCSPGPSRGRGASTDASKLLHPPFTASRRTTRRAAVEAAVAEIEAAEHAAHAQLMALFDGFFASHGQRRHSAAAVSAAAQDLAERVEPLRASYVGHFERKVTAWCALQMLRVEACLDAGATEAEEEEE